MQSGSVAECYARASKAIEALPAQRCMTCDRPFASGTATCPNALCSDPGRQFVWNYAIAMKSGALEETLIRFKYKGKTGWAFIFGRLLAGFIESTLVHHVEGALITSSPSFIAEGSDDFDHARLVLQRAEQEIDALTHWSYIFDIGPDPVIVKTGPTEKLEAAVTIDVPRDPEMLATTGGAAIGADGPSMAPPAVSPIGWGLADDRPRPAGPISEWRSPTIQSCQGRDLAWG